MQYLDTPEARTAILRVTIVAAVTILCIVAAIRTRRRWTRVVLGVVAVPLVLFVLWGIFVISLIVRFGPR
jgi:hypothetical protein